MFCLWMKLLIEAMELGLLIAGLVALFRGKISLTRGFATQGAAARLTGLIFLLPFPLAIGLSMIAATALAPPPQPPLELSIQGRVAFAEWSRRTEALAAQRELVYFAIVLGVFLVCVALAVLVVSMNRTTEEPKSAAANPANAEG